MKLPAIVAVLLTLFVLNLMAPAGPPSVLHAESAAEASSGNDDSSADGLALAVTALAQAFVRTRLEADVSALDLFRQGYPFWQHIFTIPDGSIAYGSAVDGRLLAIFPSRGDWREGATWEDPEFARLLEDRTLPRNLSARRDEVARLLEQAAGPVMHNATRGLFVTPNARRYGSFLEDWGAIYERFGVPADIGLAQVLVESGFNGRTRSRARAVGFCQWLEPNWRRLQRLAPVVIEAYNQTSQAPYCAAYLSVLATKYGSFIPALSEHHAGGTNVGRTLINGERLGGSDSRQRYLLGSDLARNLRAISSRRYRDVYGTYGVRSSLYAEMVFGNRFNVVRLREVIPQVRIHAMRAPRAIPLAEVTRRTELPVDEIRRFNPALVRQVPARANLYLPFHVPEFGPDVAFWHHPPTAEYATVLHEFLQIDVPAEQWDHPSFTPVLESFRARFEATGTEEGLVMATVLAFVMNDAVTSGRAAILDEFRHSPRIQRLVEQGVSELEAYGTTIVRLE